MKLVITGSKYLTTITPEFIYSAIMSADLKVTDITQIICRGDGGVNRTVEEFSAYVNNMVVGINCSEAKTYSIVENGGMLASPMKHPGIAPPNTHPSEIPLLETCFFYPEYEEYGKFAGAVRDRHMAEYADRVLLIWDGLSKEDKNFKKVVQNLRKPMNEIIINSYLYEEPEEVIQEM